MTYRWTTPPSRTRCLHSIPYPNPLYHTPCGGFRDCRLAPQTTNVECSLLQPDLLSTSLQKVPVVCDIGWNETPLPWIYMPKSSLPVPWKCDLIWKQDNCRRIQLKWGQGESLIQYDKRFFKKGKFEHSHAHRRAPWEHESRDQVMLLQARNARVPANHWELEKGLE